MHRVLRLRRPIYQGSYPPIRMDSYLTLEIDYPGKTPWLAFESFRLDHGTRELREIVNALIWIEYHPGSVGTSFQIALPVVNAHTGIRVEFARRDVRGVNAMKLRDEIALISAQKLYERLQQVERRSDV